MYVKCKGARKMVLFCGYNVHCSFFFPSLFEIGLCPGHCLALNSLCTHQAFLRLHLYLPPGCSELKIDNTTQYMLGAYAAPAENLVGDQDKNTTCQGRDVGVRNMESTKM